MKILLIVISLFSCIAFCDEKSYVDATVNEFKHVADSNRLILEVTSHAITTIKDVKFMKITTGYDLTCVGYPRNIYKRSKSGDKTIPPFIFFGDYKQTLTHLDDGAAYSTGYPMFDAWKALETSTEAIPCMISLKAIAGFSGDKITVGISGFGVSISGDYGANVYTHSDVNSNLVYMKPTLVTGEGSGDGGACAVAGAPYCEDTDYDHIEDPLLIDLGQDGIHLGDAGVGIAFDMNGDGEQTLVQWVASNGNEAFLVRDLNGNEIIDNGTELFGNGTRMIQGVSSAATAPNGFVALAQFDREALGGNDDGYISEADDIWPQLSLWLDSNADGISTSDEMLYLQSVGITQLGVIPKENHRNDPAGNVLPLWSWAKDENSNSHNKYKMVDVYFKGLTL